MSIAVKSYKDLTVVAQKPVAITSSGIVELVRGSAGKQIHVLLFGLSTDTEAIFTLLSGTTPLFSFPLATTGGFFRQAPFTDMPLFVAAVGEGLNLSPSRDFTYHVARCLLHYKLE